MIEQAPIEQIQWIRHLTSVLHTYHGTHTNPHHRPRSSIGSDAHLPRSSYMKGKGERDPLLINKALSSSSSMGISIRPPAAVDQHYGACAVSWLNECAPSSRPALRCVSVSWPNECGKQVRGDCLLVSMTHRSDPFCLPFSSINDSHGRRERRRALRAVLPARAVLADPGLPGRLDELGHSVRLPDSYAALVRPGHQPGA